LNRYHYIEPIISAKKMTMPTGGLFRSDGHDEGKNNAKTLSPKGT